MAPPLWLPTPLKDKSWHYYICLFKNPFQPPNKNIKKKHLEKDLDYKLVVKKKNKKNKKKHLEKDLDYKLVPG